ncbi:MAG TPA: sugar phosphate isomerase/epimerase family protein [Blastocatellia bacterium]|nr:sugar phosphate isomerase/epimerase family protein [Blastocatellia bacterium]
MAFKLSVINDEITQDLDHALAVASGEFGLAYVELRSMWGKNIMALDAKEVVEARRLLEKYKLRVSSIASPIYKVDWPGAPKSKYSSRDSFGADFTFDQQDELLDRGFELARAFNCDRIRIFDFWRLDDVAPYRAAIDERLRRAAQRATVRGLLVLLENEQSCNTATAAEARRTLDAVKEPNLKLNWDPGNAASRGETAYPDGYSLLPKDRIGYMHCKDVTRSAPGAPRWAAMGRGIIDYVGQFKALMRDGYQGTLSLETHWRGGGSPEESSRQSMSGMKDLLRRAGAI